MVCLCCATRNPVGFSGSKILYHRMYVSFSPKCFKQSFSGETTCLLVRKVV